MKLMLKIISNGVKWREVAPVFCGKYADPYSSTKVYVSYAAEQRSTV
jgi:hypothetical protein